MDLRVPPTGRIEPRGDGYVAHIEDEKGLLEGPVDGFVTVHDAIAWARERAAVVIVRRAGETVLHSAGAEPPPWDPRMPVLQG